MMEEKKLEFIDFVLSIGDNELPVDKSNVKLLALVDFLK
jgi:hypothetical protein